MSMGKRAARKQRSHARRDQESRPQRRSQLIRKASLIGGLVVGLIGVVIGGIFFVGSQSSAPAQISPSTGLEIGYDVGNHVPNFDLKLVDGRTVTSAELVSGDKPAFYFFFATW